MITRINLNLPKAKEIIDQLDKQYSHRFTKTSDSELIMTFNFFDEWGYEHHRDIHIRATKDNKAFLVFVNKKAFPKFARYEDLDEWITEHFKDYIEQVEPHIIQPF